MLRTLSKAFPVIWMSGSAQPQTHLSCCPACLPSPCSPLYFQEPPEILINLYILSTKNFLLQLLGGNGGTDCSKFSYRLLGLSTGRGGSGGGADGGNKGEKRRKKTGAVSNEVVGHDLTNSTAVKSIDLPPARPRTPCTLAWPALEALFAVMNFHEAW